MVCGTHLIGCRNHDIEAQAPVGRDHASAHRADLCLHDVVTGRGRRAQREVKGLRAVRRQVEAPCGLGRALGGCTRRGANDAHAVWHGDGYFHVYRDALVVDDRADRHIRPATPGLRYLWRDESEAAVDHVLQQRRCGLRLQRGDQIERVEQRLAKSVSATSPWPDHRC